jgi:hypothetical protein
MDAMQTRSKSKTLSELERHCSDFSAEWDASTDKKDLIRDIEEKIRPQEFVSVDSALCLGLGTFEVYKSYCDEGELDDEKSYVKHETERIFRQLLAFETVVNCLRKY